MPAPPWLTPSMKTVPDWLGASRSYWKRKLAGPPGPHCRGGGDGCRRIRSERNCDRLEAGNPSARGTSQDTGVIHCTGHCYQEGARAPFASAGALPEPQTLRTSVSPGKKPSAESAMKPPVLEGT